MEIYPYLKKTQAHFYALHCTIGKHYTIAQFKKEEDVAYETARTSMDFWPIVVFIKNLRSETNLFIHRYLADKLELKENLLLW